MFPHTYRLPKPPTKEPEWETTRLIGLNPCRRGLLPKSRGSGQDPADLRPPDPTRADQTQADLAAPDPNSPRVQSPTPKKYRD